MFFARLGHPPGLILSQRATAYTFFCANPSYLLLHHYRPGSVSSLAHCTLPRLQGLCSSFPRKLHGRQSFMIVMKPPRPGVITQRLCVLGPQSIFSESNRYWAWFQRKQLGSCRFAPSLTLASCLDRRLGSGANQCALQRKCRCPGISEDGSSPRFHRQLWDLGRVTPPLSDHLFCRMRTHRHTPCLLHTVITDIR